MQKFWCENVFIILFQRRTCAANASPQKKILRLTFLRTQPLPRSWSSGRTRSTWRLTTTTFWRSSADAWPRTCQSVRTTNVGGRGSRRPRSAGPRPAARDELDKTFFVTQGSLNYVKQRGNEIPLNCAFYCTVCTFYILHCAFCVWNFWVENVG